MWTCLQIINSVLKNQFYYFPDRPSGALQEAFAKDVALGRIFSNLGETLESIGFIYVIANMNIAK